MIVEPEQRVADFAKAGSDIISVHAEQSSTIHLHRLINAVRCLMYCYMLTNPFTSKPFPLVLAALPYTHELLIRPLHSLPIHMWTLSAVQLASSSLHLILHCRSACYLSQA